MQWFRRLSRGRRRLLIAGTVVAVLATLTLIGLFVVYPRVGAWMIEDKMVPRLERKLGGRDVTIGDVAVELGHATLRDVRIKGAADGAGALVVIDRVEIAFDTWKSFVGTAELEDVVAEGITVALRRTAGGDNFTDLATSLGLRGESAGASGSGAGSSGLGSLRPARARARKIAVTLSDEVTGTRVTIGDGEATLGPDRVLRGRLAAIKIATASGPGAEVGSLAIERPSGGAPTVTVLDAQLALWPRLALTGISGTIAPQTADQSAAAGRYDVDLAGGYGGVAGTLWTAQGWIDPAANAGAIDATADQFTLDRLAPILERSPVKDFTTTTVDARLHVDVSPALARFTADFKVAGLNLGHPMLAEQDVRDLELAGDIAGTFTRATRTLVIDKGAFESRGLPVEVSGTWAMAGGALPDGTRRPRPALDARLRIPPIDCQKALVAIPVELAPHLDGYKLRGTFRTDIHVGIDWTDLQATILDGSVRIRDCKVLARPEDSPERLLEPFEHMVELDQDEWVSFVVGPDNPAYVPITEVSPYLIKSLMTTEDSAFYQHKGFIVREFRTALVKNLEAGYFRYGASSITMQLVKNVLLYREKTLARKLQELFLTWDIENVLEKDRILEIYLNVIEYGPGLYGIGPASRHYFGKEPRDLNPVEAAFFSSILPGPKQRYKQYCDGTLTKWTSGKIERILGLMRKRDRLTEEEYQKALATPLLFVKDGSETEEQCLARAKKAIKNARPTDPMKRKDGTVGRRPKPAPDDGKDKDEDE
jgi:hypothetical protein